MSLTRKEFLGNIAIGIAGLFGLGAVVNKPKELKVKLAGSRWAPEIEEDTIPASDFVAKAGADIKWGDRCYEYRQGDWEYIGKAAMDIPQGKKGWITI